MGYLFSWASLSKSATERALDSSEILILLCGLILAIGAAGEYIEEHGTLPEWTKWSMHPKMVFVWMVALSLAGEFIGDAGVFVFSGHLQTINDGEYATLNKEAGDARRDAGTANERAGGAIERAAHLEMEAALLRNELDAQGPRSVLLSGGKRAHFISTLRPFKGQKVSIRVCLPAWNTDEARQLIIRLYSTVKEAGWDMTGNELNGANSPAGVDGAVAACLGSGMWVGLNSEAKSPQRTKDAERALLSAFKSIPLAASLHADFNSDTRMNGYPRANDPDTILIVVLLHPI
jgi:hypothetical protein